MVVGVCRVTLAVPGARSLKDKRSVVRRVKERATNRFRVSAAEVDLQDVLNRAVLGFAAVSSSPQVVAGVLERILAFIDAMGIAPIVGDERDVFRFDDGDFSQIDDWAGHKYE